MVLVDEETNTVGDIVDAVDVANETTLGILSSGFGGVRGAQETG